MSRRAQLRQLVHFLLGSGLGLAVDLALFAVGVHLGLEPWLANAISAAAAVVVVYVVATRYAFAGGGSFGRFLLFVSWYVVSIITFSFLIDLLHGVTGWAPFVCKLVSVLPSFAANFAASKLLFRQRTGPTGPEGRHRPASPALRDAAA